MKFNVILITKKLFYSVQNQLFFNLIIQVEINGLFDLATLLA